MKEKNRCGWTSNDALMNQYHDAEWGVPLHNDRKIFEFMVLDAFQAGLSWKTILYKRKNFEKAFDNFDYRKIARYSETKIKKLLTDAGIIRNRLKIRGTVQNAKAFLAVQKEFKTFDNYIWQFTKRRTIRNTRHTVQDIPARSPESDAMSADLRSRGFTFVGSTICYAFMQAAGMVNDHTVSCFRYRMVAKRNRLSHRQR